ncbi:hypothetical protein Tco_0598805 [Tanacetum coccineum]
MSCDIEHDYHSLGHDPEAIEELVNRRVEEVLAAHEATRAANALEAENQSQNGSDGDNGNDGNGDGENGNGGNGNLNENGRGDRLVARECTYQDFIKCQPLNFKGTEGVVDLIRWFEKMETVFHISNYPEKYQVKYATCTLLNSALTGNNDLAAYPQRFQELTMMCTKMVPEEEDWVEKFIGGVPDNIQGNVIVVEPTRLQDAVRIANNLMDQKLRLFLENEFWIVQGDRDVEREVELSIICAKKVISMLRKDAKFSGIVNEKGKPVQSEEKAIEGRATVYDFSEFFPDGNYLDTANATKSNFY